MSDSRMPVQTGDLSRAFMAIDEPWRPKVAAQLNGQEVKIVKTRGIFPWHRHETCEEMFMVWRGRFRVEFRDRIIDMGPGEFCVVPPGVEHRTASDEEAQVLIFEPANVANTGDAALSSFTAPSGVRIA